MNVHGHPGKNISANLLMEHLNRLVKEAIKNLGANKTEKSISRIGRAIGTIATLLYQYDHENNVTTLLGAHHIATSEKDRNNIFSELVRAKVFNKVLGGNIALFQNHDTFFMQRLKITYNMDDE